jgi:hypothetical protein
MGCDFKFIIQVLYGDKWINVVHLKTFTTFRGVLPLGQAPYRFYKEKLVKGDFHRHETVACGKGDFATKLIIQKSLCGSPIELASGKTCEKGETNKKKGFEDDEYDDDEDDEDDEEKKYLFYSQEHFESLLTYIPLHQPGENDYYRCLIKPITNWMVLAKSALPVIGYIWLGCENDLQKSTLKIQNKREELKKEYQQMLSELDYWPVTLPREVLDQVGEYAVPVGSNVRLAWWDDKGYTEYLVDYVNDANDLKQMRG